MMLREWVMRTSCMRGFGKVDLGLETMRLEKWGSGMRVGHVAVAASLGLMFSVCAQGQNPVYDRPVKELSVHVKILATSTAVHQNFAGNEYVYIANVTSSKLGTQMVKLVDKFPASEQPIRNDLLVEQRSFRMQISRDHSCDGAFIGNESQIYDASALKSLTPEERLQMPCYRIDHSATRLAK